MARPELFTDPMMEALLYVFARDERLLRHEVAVAEVLEHAERSGRIKAVARRAGPDKRLDCQADGKKLIVLHPEE